MKKIRWTTREWQLVADRLAANGVIPSEHGWRGHLIGAMQAVLPKERWREATNMNEAKKKLIPLMKHAGEKSTPSVSWTPPTPTPINLTSFSTEDLIAEVVKRAVAGITEQIKAQVALQMEQRIETTDSGVRIHLHKHNPFGSTGLPHEAPRVLVVGPLEGQQRELRNVHTEFTLRFVGSDENPARVAEVGFAADHVILWTNFISHAHQDQAKKFSASLHYVTGGMSALHDKLREIS